MEVDFRFQNQWSAGPEEELRIPEAYVRELKFEVVVFGRRKDFTFRCKSYYPVGNDWVFEGVIVDTSKRGSTGDVVLKRLTYHPTVSLINTGFMVIPAPEPSAFETSSDSLP